MKHVGKAKGRFKAHHHQLPNIEKTCAPHEIFHTLGVSLFFQTLQCARWCLDPTNRWTDFSRTVSWTKTTPKAYPSHQKSRDRAHLSSLCGTSRTCLRPSLASLSSHFLLVAFQNRNCYKTRGDDHNGMKVPKWLSKGIFRSFGHLSTKIRLYRCFTLCMDACSPGVPKSDCALNISNYFSDLFWSIKAPISVLQSPCYKGPPA